MGGPNLYAYAGDNPVNCVDRSGFLLDCCSGGGGGGGGSGGGGPTPSPTSGAGVSTSGSLDPSSGGPVWTEQCTDKVILFAILLGFTLLGAAIGGGTATQFACR